MSRVLRVGVLLAALVAPSLALAGGRSTPVFLVVTKSQNKNQVHYAMRVDADCRPTGDGPAFAFWHMLERGRGVYEGLLSREEGVYGIRSQSAQTANETSVRVAALAKRPLVVRTMKTPAGECRAEAFTTLAGVRGARLEQVHAELAWPFGVKYLLLLGHGPDGKPLEEKISP